MCTVLLVTNASETLEPGAIFNKSITHNLIEIFAHLKSQFFSEFTCTIFPFSTVQSIKFTDIDLHFHRLLKEWLAEQIY